MTTPIEPLIQRRCLLRRAAAVPWRAGLGAAAPAQQAWSSVILRMGGYVLAPMVTRAPLNSKLRDIRSLQQLAGLSLGRQLGSALSPQLESVPIKWVLAPGRDWQITNLRMTAAGRLQGSVFYNAISLAYLAKTEGIAARLLPLPLPPILF